MMTTMLSMLSKTSSDITDSDGMKEADEDEGNESPRCIQLSGEGR